MKLEIDDKDWAQIGMIVSTIFAGRRGWTPEDRLRYLTKVKEMKLTEKELEMAFKGLASW
jgi:hypothetical protein